MADDEPVRYMLAFLFQRSGRVGMSENELANAVSLDLKWYAPKVAREFIAGMVRAGWLERDDEGDLEPTFDVKVVKVPIGFRPPPEVPRLPPPGSHGLPDTRAVPPVPAQATASPSAPGSHPEVTERGPGADSGPSSESRPVSVTDDEPVADTLLGRLLERLSGETGEERGIWVARMDKVVQRTQDAIAPEVALLVAAAKEGVAVEAWLDEARALVLGSS